MEKKLRELIKEALIEKDKQKQITYKNILEIAQKTAKDNKIEMSDSLIITAVKKEIKQLEELRGYCKEDTVRFNRINSNIALCKELLPEMVDSKVMFDYLVESNIDKNMGACMKALKNKYGDCFDGKEANLASKEYIKN